MKASRPSVTVVHDDGVNAWRTTRVGPSPELAADIAGYADYQERTGGFTLRRELPHAEGVLIVNLGEPIRLVGGDGCGLQLRAGQSFVAGAHLRPALSSSGGSQAGMHVFLPLSTLRRLLGVPMGELVDRVVPLDAVLGGFADALGTALGAAPDQAARVAILDAALARRLGEVPRLDARQTAALRLLRGRPGLDVAEVAREVGWSRKHLAARVRDAMGVGPRCFRRLLRFQSLTRMTAGHARPDWPDLAQRAGYCDQSHMIREFREFTGGLTPTAYLARLLPDGGGLVEG